MSSCDFTAVSLESPPRLFGGGELGSRNNEVAETSNPGTPTILMHLSDVRYSTTQQLALISLAGKKKKKLTGTSNADPENTPPFPHSRPLQI